METTYKDDGYVFKCEKVQLNVALPVHTLDVYV